MTLEYIGRQRLKLRLPDRRGALIGVSTSALKQLCVAYAKAAIFRDELRAMRGADHNLIREYDLVCREIEEDVVRHLALQDDRKASPTTGR